MAAIRMKDLAQDLGVSIVTISKSLRDHPDIARATKERVLPRVKELNYTPNLMARGLVTGRSCLIALVVPDLLNSFFVEIAASLSTELRKHGYSLLISWTAEDPDVEATEIQHLLSVGMDAMIIATSTSTDQTSSFRMLEDRKIPYVLLDRDIPQLKAPFIGMDDLLIGKMATQHLIDIGCKRIGHISGPPMSPGFRRLEGYRKALGAAGLRQNPEYIVAPSESGPRGFQHGLEATQRLLKVKPRVDGIFCFNDPVGVGAIEAVRAAGLKIPQDVAMIGCGNLPIARTLILPLSTVDQNTKAIGEKSAKLVLDMLKRPDKDKAQRRVLLKPQLLVRGTSARNGSPKRSKVST
jgi:LacI family transcriptional regulator